MKAEDLIPAGDRAKRHLRIAQALAMLSKTRAPSLSRVKDALARVQGNQPAVAMAVILEYSKRHPLYERGDWLKAAGEALQEYRLTDDADQKEAELARDHIEHEVSLHKAEMERIERMRERFSMAILCLLVSLLMTGIAYFGFTFVKGLNDRDNEKEMPSVKNIAPVEKGVEKTTEKNAEEKAGSEKASKPDAKKADKDRKPATPSGK